MSTLSLDKFLQLTAAEFTVSQESISLDTVFRHIPSWNSLNALLYISKINEETGVFITSGDLSALVSLADIFNLINSQCNGTN